MNKIIGYVAFNKKFQLPYAGVDGGSYGSGYLLLLVNDEHNDEQEMILRKDGFLGIMNYGIKLQTKEAIEKMGDEWEPRAVGYVDEKV